VVSDFKTPIGVGALSSSTANQIVEDVVATVLDIAVTAWPRVCDHADITPNSPEDDITDCFRWKMVAEKNRRDPTPQIRFERETQRDDPEEQYPTGLIDIHVTYSFDETCYFAMECKKVTDRHKAPADHYIQEGVCRFSSGKYSPGHPYGTMVGFVTEGTAEDAAAYLGPRIIAFDRKTTKLRTGWGWQNEERFGAIPHLHSTKHGQAGTRNTILLLHLFLPFATQN
jgi:hypothetical protein